MFIAALFTVDKTWKQHKCPSKEGWMIMWYIYTVEYHSVMKKNEIMPVEAIQMDLWKWKKVLVIQSFPTFCDHKDCIPPGSSVHGTLQARMLEWVAISSLRGSSWPRDWTWIFCIAGRFFIIWATREALLNEVSQKEEKYCMMSFICGLQKEILQMNFQNRKRLTDLENELTLWLPGERDSQGVWEGHGTHWYTQNGLTNKDLLYNIWNTAQHYVPTWMGEGLGGEWIHVYVQLSPFTVHLKLPQTC